MSPEQAAKLERLCEAIVPGSSRVGPVVYIDALIAGMPPAAAAEALRSIDALDPDRLAEQAHTPEFGFVRALAVEAFYSDFVAPGRDGPGAWAEIDFNSPLATRLAKDWSFLGVA